jgi:hypothetical protein
MSAAGWFIVLLAFVGANVPFVNQRLFAAVPLKAAKKSAWIRIAELIVLYFLVGALAVLRDHVCSVRRVRFPRLHFPISRQTPLTACRRRAPRCSEVRIWLNFRITTLR